MESMVLELQREAYQQHMSVSVLLRKAYILARKIKVVDFKDWVEMELNGYKNGDEIPDYRIVHGETKALNPYYGYIPAYFQEEIDKLISKKNIALPITEIEDVVERARNNGDVLMYNHPPAAQKMLMKFSQAELQFSLHVPVSQFNKILDKVRNIILEWTMKLYEEGVTGEGMTFSEKEKEIAVRSTPPVINYIGTMVNSQIQQNTEHSTQKLSQGEFRV